MSQLFKIADANGQKRASVIFVHGLGGDAYRTWSYGTGDAAFWPKWLAADVPGLAVYSVGYETPVSRWRGTAMHLPDRAKNVLEQLLVYEDLAKGPLIFIGHSLGGLVIKQMLRIAESEGKYRKEAADLIGRVGKIAFLATPHTGAGLASFSDWLRVVIRPSEATASLVRNDPYLRDLNLWYRDWANRLGIPHLILTETIPTRILGMIVQPDSADPGIVGARAVPIDATHTGICKPDGKTHEVYVQVRAFIERVAQPRGDPLAQQVAALANEQRAARQEQQAVGAHLAALTETMAREKGIAAAPLRNVLQKLGEAGIPDENIPARLAAAADELVALRHDLAKLRNDRPELAAIRAQAVVLIDRGDLDGARAALGRGREELHVRRAEDSRIEADFLAEEARIDHLQLAYRAAAAKFAEAARVVAPDVEAQWSFLFRQARELYDWGKEFGDNTALLEAIEIYKSYLTNTSRAKRPLNWAATQNDLGTALATLGARESGTAHLQEAVEAFRAALHEFPRERVPHDWAMTQNNLGNALRRLGERESDTGLLEESVTAYRRALKEWARERVPLDWAMTQNNLGNALARLGERESGTARLEEAVEAYRAALQEWTRDRVPLQWAMTQNNLGAALRNLGERGSDTARLEEAVEAYREALHERTRERVPLDWATTQNNFGSALATLGARESGTARLEEAVEAFRKALQERTRERVPLDWASTQNNLGNALRRLGERESGTARLEEAVGAYHAALQEKTQERVPLQWATAQNNLGTALAALGDRESGSARLEEAIAAYRAALLERTRERVPRDWAITQTNLGIVLTKLGERETGTSRLEEAVEAYRAALEVFEAAEATHYIEAAWRNRARAEALLVERQNAATAT